MLFTVLCLSMLLILQLINVQDRTPSKPAGAAPEAAKPGKVEPDYSVNSLRVSVSLAEDEFADLKRRTDRYVDEQNIDISLENLPQDTQYSTLKRLSTLGEAPDIMLLDNSWIAEFAALGYLNPLDEFFSGEKQTGYLTSAINQNKWNGYTWGVPKDVDPYVIIWNEQLAKSGKWEHSPANRDEMLAWNKEWMKPDQGMYGIYFDPDDYMAFLSIYSIFSGSIPEEGNPLKEAANESILQPLQNFLLPQETEWKGAVFAKNYPQPSAEFSPWDLLEKGKMAAIVTTLSQYRKHGSSAIKLGALPISGNGKTPGSWLMGRSFAVSSRSANSAAAMNWIESVTSADAQSQAWKLTGKLPSLLASYSSPQLRQEEQYDSYAWLVQEGVTPPLSFDAAKREDMVREEGMRLSSGTIDLKAYAMKLAESDSSSDR